MEYIKLGRPKHYIKNLLIFLPLIFSKNLLDYELTKKVLLAFICFSFLTSVVYIVNDICDLNKDKKDPKKCKRPIASGKISIQNALLYALILLLLSIIMNYFATDNFINSSTLILGVYLIINFLYSIKLKDIPLVDISILVSGFLIRIMYGSMIINVPISNWLYFTVLSFAFYFSLGKRKSEKQRNGDDCRKVLKYYSIEFLEKNMNMCLQLAIIFYSLWTIESGEVIGKSNYLSWTVPFVILISMKYGLDIEKSDTGDPIEIVFRDKILLTSILLYGISLLVIIY